MANKKFLVVLKKDTAATDNNDSNLLAAVQILGQLSLLISEVTTEGFSFDELGSLLSLIAEVKALLPNAAQLLTEYTNLTDAAKAELIAAITASVKFPGNTNVEKYVQLALESLVNLSSLFSIL